MINFNEDEHQNRLLDKHLEDDIGSLSNCCEALILEDSDICSECGKHCVTVTEDNEMCRDDFNDSKSEEMRDERNNN